jgi:methyl coenzyme M reductase gamma subunit
MTLPSCTTPVRTAPDKQAKVNQTIQVVNEPGQIAGQIARRLAGADYPSAHPPQQILDFPAAQSPADHLLRHLAGARLVELVRLDEFTFEPCHAGPEPRQGAS